MESKRLMIDGEETPYLLYEDGTIYSEKRKRFLKGTITEEGYVRICTLHKGKNIYFLLHRKIAEYFLPNPNNLPMVHHKNHIRNDNRVENLEWVSAEQNAQDHLVRAEQRVVSQEPLDDNWVPTTIDPNYLVNEHGQCINSKTGKILAGGRRNGYVRYNIGGNFRSAHCLVWEAFYGYLPDYIDHIDGNKENNALTNLREVSQSENMKNAYANGHKGQCPIQQIDADGNIVAIYKTIQEAADAMGVSHPAIRSAAVRKGTCKGYYWQRISGPTT